MQDGRDSVGGVAERSRAGGCARCKVSRGGPPDQSRPVRMHEPSQEALEDFHRLRRLMNSVSAEAPGYKVLCATLLPDWAPGMEPELQLSDGVTVSFRHWQVTGAAWVRMMKKSPLDFGILADDTGLGKTLTSIFWLWTDYQKRMEAPQTFDSPPNPVENSLLPLQQSPYRPSIVVLPLSAIEAWTDKSKGTRPAGLSCPM
jgi:SNF2 family DNA or RNA helicase